MRPDSEAMFKTDYDPATGNFKKKEDGITDDAETKKTSGRNPEAWAPHAEKDKALGIPKDNIEPGVELPEYKGELEGQDIPIESGKELEQWRQFWPKYVAELSDEGVPEYRKRSLRVFMREAWRAQEEYQKTRAEKIAAGIDPDKEFRDTLFRENVLTDDLMAYDSARKGLLASAKGEMLDEDAIDALEYMADDYWRMVKKGPNDPDAGKYQLICQEVIDSLSTNSKLWNEVLARMDEKSRLRWEQIKKQFAPSLREAGTESSPFDRLASDIKKLLKHGLKSVDARKTALTLEAYFDWQRVLGLNSRDSRADNFLKMKREVLLLLSGDIEQTNQILGHMHWLPRKEIKMELELFGLDRLKAA